MLRGIISSCQSAATSEIVKRCYSSFCKQRYSKYETFTQTFMLSKVIRSVLLGRPVHMYRYIADLLDVELAQRTFDDIMYGCMLKKSKHLEPYPSESCKLFESFLAQLEPDLSGPDQFMMGPIPDYELEKPALDRYRDYAGIGVFDMTGCELGGEPEPLQTAELQVRVISSGGPRIFRGGGVTLGTLISLSFTPLLSFSLTSPPVLPLRSHPIPPPSSLRCRPLKSS